MNLGGKTALITGAARGIGQAVAIELATRGANIALCDLDDAAVTIAAVEKLGRRALYGRGDVNDRSEMEAFFGEAAATFPSLDILVNNAAMSIRKPLLDLEVADVEKVWAVTLWGVFHCTQLAARRMVAQGTGGSIVSISSVHAVRGYPLSTAYNGAKAAVNHMSRTWASELAAHRIRVNVIEPGWTDTPGERNFCTEEQLQEEAKKLPFGRLARPEEIAHAVAFLVSDDAAYITGSALRVDGGIILPR